MTPQAMCAVMCDHVVLCASRSHGDRVDGGMCIVCAVCCQCRIEAHWAASASQWQSQAGASPFTPLIAFRMQLVAADGL